MKRLIGNAATGRICMMPSSILISCTSMTEASGDRAPISVTCCLAVRRMKAHLAVWFGTVARA